MGAIALIDYEILTIFLRIGLDIPVKKETCTHRLKFHTRTQCSMYLATSKSTTKKWKCRWCMVNASWQFPQFWLALYHTNLLMLNWYDLPPLSVKCWWHAKFRVHSFLFRQRRRRRDGGDTWRCPKRMAEEKCWSVISKKYWSMSDSQLEWWFRRLVLTAWFFLKP